MATANRVITVRVSGGGLNEYPTFAAAENASSPGSIVYTDLSSGANTINKPTGATAVTYIPPAGNTILVTLKGISGDTGVKLHNTDPTSVALDSSVSTFVLTAASAVAGARLVWT